MVYKVHHDRSGGVLHGARPGWLTNVFLRGYLEGEPKRLVEGIAVTEETYEQRRS